ncbi:MAG: beta-propeller fold lactonase family protein, partial [Planctomycetaceae bacterium]
MAGECRCATQLTQRCRRGPGLLWKPWPGPSRTVLNYFATGTARMQTGGREPRNFFIEPTGKWLLAENQNSDSVFVFSINQ